MTLSVYLIRMLHLRLMYNNKKILFFGILLFASIFSLFAVRSDNELYSDGLYNQVAYGTSLYDDSIYTKEVYNKDIYSEKNAIFNGSDSDLTLIGSYAVSRENVIKNSTVSSRNLSFVDSNVLSIENSYVGDGQKFKLKKNQSAFIKDFSKWQYEYTDPDFWNYVEEQEQYIRLLYTSAVMKYGIGASVIAVPYLLSIMLPDGGTIAIAATIIYKSSENAAMIGIIEEAIRKTAVCIMENKDSDILIAEVANSGADGFLIGAVSGFFGGLSKAKGLHKVGDDFVNKAGDVFNSKGKLIGKAFKNKSGLYTYYKALKDKKLYTLLDEPIDALVKSADKDDILYYTAGHLLKSLDDGDVVGNIIEKNGIKYIFSNSSARPIAAINKANELVTDNVLKRVGIKNASLATLFSDTVDKNSSPYYRALYALAHPNVKLGKGDVIHHSIERQVLNLYPGAFSKSEILSDGASLRGIPKEMNSNVHLSQIRQIWDETYNKINDVLYENDGIWDYNTQKEYIRKTIFDTRDQIDNKFKNIFIENNL